MSLALESPVALRELVELLRSGPRGTLAIAVCDSMPQARGLIAMLGEQLPLKLVEASFGERQRTLFDLLEAYRLRPGDVICLLDLQRATEGTLRSLDMQRELLVEHQVSAICWVTRAAQRDLAVRAPNFYAFRTLLLDFTESTEPDPSRYLQDLRDATAAIVIHGLQIGRGRAARFPLERWYLGLHAASRLASNEEPADEEADGDGSTATDGGDLSRWIPFEQLLSQRRLLIVGHPGCGKTTFLRWVALTLCQTWLGENPTAARERLGLSDALFPVFVQATEFEAYFRRRQDRGELSTGNGSAAWLPDYLAWLNVENRWGLDPEFFEHQLTDGNCTVLLDGLDELPDVAARTRMVQRMENAAFVYGRCRFVVTTRPAALSDEVRLAGWTYAYVEPLSDGAVEEFFARWCAALYPDSPEATRTHTEELLNAVRVRPEIRRIAGNPVMLTALVVVHWNEKRLPEQRADLYESILSWLSRSREQRPGRPSPERCLGLLQKLALEMHDHPAGRQVQVSRDWAATAMEDGFRELHGRDQRIAAAEQFLAAEELDSGIIVSRGKHDVKFWHLTFQEYLAARALAACSDRERDARLLATDKLVQPEWREVFLLLAGVLYHHGIEALDRLFAAVLDQLPTETPLASLTLRARVVGLLGAAVRELAVLNYRPVDARYPRLLQEVLAIFDPKRSRGLPIRDAIEAAEALGQAGDPRFAACDAESLWVAIPERAFWMGGQKTKPRGHNYDPDASDVESPVHRVQLPSYRIGRYPVTVLQYREFVEQGGYENEVWWTAGGFGRFSRPDDWDAQLEHPTWPVTWVCWYEAQAHCRWAGCRLPSEAEWERAARGDDGRRFPWGDAPPDATRMNYGWQIGTPTPVGVYPLGHGPLGIADMAGNVWEWCADAYGRYPVDHRESSSPATIDFERVVRGGSWHDQATSCRVSARSPLRPDYRDVNVGFRAVRTPRGSDDCSA